MLSLEMYRFWLFKKQKSDTADHLPVRLIELEIFDNLRLVEFGSYKYFLPKSIAPEQLLAVYKEIFYERHPHHYEYGDCQIRSGDVVIDGGASEGFFTRFALSKGAKVIIVEPSQIWIDALMHTFKNEISLGQVVIERACLGSHIGEMSVDVSKDLGWVNDYTESYRETVAVTTIDKLVASSPWQRCNFIKMDIEGSEFDAIAGATRTLNTQQPCLSVAVYHRPTGYLDLRRNLLSMTGGYHIAAKGLHPHFGYDIPVMLHAWPTCTTINVR